MYNSNIWKNSLANSNYTASEDFFLGSTSALTNGGNTLSLESYQEGRLYNITENTYLDVLYDNRFDYDVTGRYLQGSYSDIAMNGTIEGNEFEIICKIRLVKQGYSGLDTPIIDEFAFNMGLELIISSLVLFNIILVKRKRKIKLARLK